MIMRIYTDVTDEQFDILAAEIDADEGTLTKTTQEDGKFTVTAQMPGPDPLLPALPTSAPWMAIAEAERAKGVRELRSNPIIEDYFATTTFGRHPDSEPWCSAFVNFCVIKSGHPGTNSALARSWLEWGVDAGAFVPGCIVVLTRGTAGQGHVGFFVGTDARGSIQLLGGNQSDSVNISSFPNAQVLGKRTLQASSSGASSGASDAASGSGGPAPSADDGIDTLARRAFDFFVQSGWSPAQAAGLIANIEAESSFQAHGPAGDHGAALGLCQWHEDRFNKFSICFPGRTFGSSTFDEQLQFVNFELLDPRGGEGGAARHLKQAATASEAGGVVSQFYERPADKQGNIELRGRLAVKWFNRFAG